MTGMSDNKIERSIWIAAPRERVWQAVYEPEQLAQWFLPPALGAQLSRDDSGKLSVMMGPMAIEVAIQEQVSPPKQLTSRGLPDRQIAATYALEEERDGTRVTVRLTGLESLPAAAAQERLEPSSTGWEKALQNLKAFVEGQPLPHPEGVLTSVFGYRRESSAVLAVERSIWINAPRERVWRAITDPKEIEKWFSPGTAWEMSALEPGGRLYVYDSETKTEKYTQVVDRVEPPNRYVTHSLAEGTAPSFISDWTLAEENGGTRLTLTYSGYELEAADTRHANMEQTGFGFGMMLDNVRAYVEGHDLPVPGGF
jgi:uncharacterized protein YndB with AHSA1/START domain